MAAKFKRVGKGTDYPAFVRCCDANKSLTRSVVAEKMGLGVMQGVAFAARLAESRGENKNKKGTRPGRMRRT
jgi:hypothetical protein